jgi:hypothetical protein
MTTSARRLVAIGVWVAVAGVLLGSECAPGNVDLTNCSDSVSGFGWSIWVTGGTPDINSTELRVGQTVDMVAQTISVLCTVPAYTVAWSHSNPAVATLAPQAGRRATLLGVAPGSTLVTAEVRGGDGARRSAEQELRIVP